MEEYRRSASYFLLSIHRLTRTLETNIMVGTHADSLIAEAAVKGFSDTFNTTLAYEAVHKDATVPPANDWTTQYV